MKSMTEQNNENEILKENSQTIQEQLDQQKDKYLRIIADYENRMKFTRQDSINSLNIAIENILTDFTPVIDHLIAAKNSLEKKDQVGLEMIIKEALSILLRYGVQQINAQVDQDFDPNLHESIASENFDGIEAGKIGKVLTNGYTRNNKCIIPSRVITAI
jgi:molecular chaperone GrpE